MSSGERKYSVQTVLRFPRFRKKGDLLVCKSGISIRSDIPVDASSVRFLLGETELAAKLSLRTVRDPGESAVTKKEKEYRYSGRLSISVSPEIYENFMGKRYVMMEIPCGEDAPRVKLYSRWYYGKYASAIRDQAFAMKEKGLTCFFLMQSKGLSFSVREYNRTDLAGEKAKIAAAFFVSRFWWFRRPVMLYEKKAERYEESASVVYERLTDLGYKKVYFLLDDTYAFRDSIPGKYRKNIISKFSFRHYLTFFAARTFIGTEAVVHMIGIRPISKYLRWRLYRSKYNYVFLQHGVMYMISLDAEQRVIFRFNRRGLESRVVVSSKLEAAHFMNQGGFSRKEIYITGLPKYDRNISSTGGTKIGIMLTWRPWEEAQCREDVTQTSYYRALERIFAAIPESYREHVVILAHPLFEEALAGAETGLSRYILKGQKFDEVLRTLTILITDYSSISYDAFYRGANIIFDWTEKDECVSHYGESAKLMLTEELAFGDVCRDSSAITELIGKRYGAPPDSRYQQNYSALVEFCDGKNTERLIRMMKDDGFIHKKEKVQKEPGRFRKKWDQKMAAWKSAKEAVDPSLAYYHRMMKEPLDERAFVLEAGQGKNIHGNMFVLLQELETNPEWSGYQPYFVVSGSTAVSAAAKLAHYAYTKTKLVSIGSDEYRRLLATAKYLATDNSFPAWYIRREGQVVLNTWHGTPLKQLGRSNIMESTSIANVQKNYFFSDYILFPNEYTRDIFFKDYMLAGFAKGTQVLADYPRNAALTALSEEERASLLGRLGVSGKKIYAYMPTWRGNGRTVDEEKQVAQVTGILFELDQYLRDDEVLLVNLHFLVDNTIDYGEFKHIRRFPPTYETYEILGACDVLITDYSSVFFDFAVTGKPVVLYAYDYEKYLGSRGTYFSMDELPFPITKNVRDLLAVLRSGAETDPEAYEEFRKKYCPHMLDRIPERVIRLMTTGDPDGLCTEQNGETRDNLLVYRGNIAGNGVQKKILTDIEKNRGSGKQLVALFSDAIVPKTGAFLRDLPQEAEYVRLLRMHFDSKSEAFSYLKYRMTGKKDARLRRMLEREYEHQLKYLLPAGQIVADDNRSDTSLLVRYLAERQNGGK